MRAATVQPGDPAPGEFEPCAKWDGPRPGMVYKAGVHGPGYYMTAASTAKLAAQIKAWCAETLANVRPSYCAVDVRKPGCENKIFILMREI